MQTDEPGSSPLALLNNPCQLISDKLVRFMSKGYLITCFEFKIPQKVSVFESENYEFRFYTGVSIYNF